MRPERIRQREIARSMRLQGRSYLEIAEAEEIRVPRGTVISWCKGLHLPAAAKASLEKYRVSLLRIAQEKSAASSRRRKLERKDAAMQRASGFEYLLNDAQVKKIMLGILYLAEGSKGDRSALTFGNSDPEIIALYLSLLRDSLPLDERKFRCTLQARKGQKIQELESFWSRITNIPPNQFYGARIDSRGKDAMRKPEYKGVCRIDYLSTEVLYEVQAIGRILAKGH